MIPIQYFQRAVDRLVTPYRVTPGSDLRKDGTFYIFYTPHEGSGNLGSGFAMTIDEGFYQFSMGIPFSRQDLLPKLHEDKAKVEVHLGIMVMNEVIADLILPLLQFLSLDIIRTLKSYLV